jgi:hypothetical protein
MDRVRRGVFFNFPARRLCQATGPPRQRTSLLSQYQRQDNALVICPCVRGSDLLIAPLSASSNLQRWRVIAVLGCRKSAALLRCARCLLVAGASHLGQGESLLSSSTRSTWILKQGDTSVTSTPYRAHDDRFVAHCRLLHRLVRLAPGLGRPSAGANAEERRPSSRPPPDLRLGLSRDSAAHPHRCRAHRRGPVGR